MFLRFFAGFFWDFFSGRAQSSSLFPGVVLAGLPVTFALSLPVERAFFFH